MHWIKAFHVIAMVAWFSALFYLPRLFVYHSTTTDAPGKARFIIMEHKLYYYIMMPAAILTTGVGILLAVLKWPEVHTALWFYVKIGLVAILWYFHFACGRWLRAFKADKSTHSERFYRMVNEVPTILLIAIVLLVYLKP